MDVIEEVLKNKAENVSIGPAIAAALNVARHTLDRYYSLTDSTAAYRIAMGAFLHSQWLCLRSNEVYSVAPTLQARLLPPARLGTRLG